MVETLSAGSVAQETGLSVALSGNPKNRPRGYKT